MTKNQRILLLGVIALTGGAAIFMFLSRGSSVDQAPIQVVKPIEEKTVRVLVADKDFARGERLGAETTKWVQWPEKALSESYITEQSGANQENFNEAVARTLIVAGEPIIEAKIVRAGDAGLMAAVLSPGMRAVTMRVSPETAAGGFILPGDYVDVHYTESDGDSETNIMTLLENVRVLAVNAIYSESPETPNIAGSNLTVELSPEDAEYFVAARSSRGELSLALRSIHEADETIKKDRRNADVEVIRYGRS